MDGEVQSATKAPVDGPDAVLEVLAQADELYVTKGKKILHFDLKGDRPDDEELLGLVMGRSGKLRAPAIRLGRKLLVGYTPELLETQLR